MDLLLTISLLISGYFIYNRIIRPILLKDTKDYEQETEDIDYEEID